MSPRTTICPDCGNEISRWDNGVCAVCSMGGFSVEGGVLVVYGHDNITNYDVALGRRPDLFIFRPIEAPLQKPPAVQTSRKLEISKPASSVTKITSKEIRAFGFDRLLRDIYNKEITFAEILIKLGMPTGKFQNKNHNSMWSLAFLESLESAVSNVLKTIPNCQPKVLIYWYGLDGEYPRSIYKISEEIGISREQVELSRKAGMQFLKGRDGMRRLEQEISKWSAIDI